MNFFNRLFNRVSSLFEAEGNCWSSTRFIFVFSAMLSNIVIMGGWLGLSIYANQLLPIDSSIIILYCLANGITATTKLIQKGQEKVTEDKKDVTNVNP